MSAASPSRNVYVIIWIALLALLLLTWGLAELDLGPFNNIAAVGISFAKMMLVVLFFMHVRYESKLTWVFAAAGLIWFLIMVDLTLSDYLTRDTEPGMRESWKQGTAISDRQSPRTPDHQ